MIRDPSGERVGVDRDIVWLIRDLWNAGVRTLFSCQGGSRVCPQGYVAYHADDHEATLATVPWPTSFLRLEDPRPHPLNDRCIRFPAVVL